MRRGSCAPASGRRWVVAAAIATFIIAMAGSHPAAQRIKRADDKAPPVIHITSPAPGMRVESVAPSIEVADLSSPKLSQDVQVTPLGETTVRLRQAGQTIAVEVVK